MESRYRQTPSAREFSADCAPVNGRGRVRRVTESSWVRASVVTAGLAGSDGSDFLPALDPADRADWARVHSRLRASGDRRSIARALVRERLSLAAREDTPTDATRGAELYARWMRGLGAGERSLLARSLDGVTAERVTVAARTADALTLTQQDQVTWLVACARATLGSLPSAGELAEVVRAWRAEGAVSGERAVRIERAVRVAGRRSAFVALARELWS